MKIYRLRLLLFAAVFMMTACGIKAPPVPKETLEIPQPVSVGLALRDNGVLVTNGDATSTVLVEKTASTGGFFRNRMFKRVSMIRPNSVYLDEDVEEETTYTYRFRNYSTQYHTYSRPTVKTIKYFALVKLGDVQIEQHEKSACINTELNSVTEYAAINVNGHGVGFIEKDGVPACFDLPGSLIVNIMIMPYDYNGNAGTPYATTLKRDEALVLLPPQNAKALREKDTIVLTWDKAENVDGYIIYVKDEVSLKWVTETDVTLYRYLRPVPQGCVNFELSARRGEDESDRVKITSCP